MAQRIQIFNGRKKTKGKKKKAARRNIGQLSFMFNGGRVASKKKNKGKKKSRNPFGGRRRSKGYASRSRRHSRRNPAAAIGRGDTSMSAILEYGGGAAASALVPSLILSNFAPQFNSGPMGYVGDILIGGALAFVGGKFLGRRVLIGGLAGTAVALAIRAAQDFSASPSHAVAADVRDAQAAQAGGGAPGVSGPGRRRMGTIVQFPFNVPQTYQVVNGQLVPVSMGLPAGPPNGGAPAGGAMSGMGRGVPSTRALDRRRRY